MNTISCFCTAPNEEYVVGGVNFVYVDFGGGLLFGVTDLAYIRNFGNLFLARFGLSGPPHPPVLDYDARFIMETFPRTLHVGQSTQVSVAMGNAGSMSWPYDNTILFYSENTPLNLWAVVQATYPEYNRHAEFYFNITAPPITGTFRQKWQMFHTGPSGRFFGDVIDIPVTVVP
jgi:hypothetical protein